MAHFLKKYLRVLIFLMVTFLHANIMCAVNDTSGYSQMQSKHEDSIAISNDYQSNTAKEELYSDTSNQHDWLFYFLNVLITSAVTLLINYLNLKFEIIKLQKEPSIDRLKTIYIESIKTEKKIYTDLKMAQEHLSFRRKNDALTVATATSNYLEDNKLDVKPSLYSLATDIISYITSVAQGKNSRSELCESKLFEAYFKEYRK